MSPMGFAAYVKKNQVSYVVRLDMEWHGDKGHGGVELDHKCFNLTSCILVGANNMPFRILSSFLVHIL